MNSHFSPAAAEVIVACGAVDSPQRLLQLTVGIGRADAYPRTAAAHRHNTRRRRP